MSLLVAALAPSAPLVAANPDGSSAEVGNAEAARLYAEANDYVTTMAEGKYSYAYLQFYWKHAQSNVDRVRRVYPDSPTSRAMARGELKLGPYPLAYFKERVLYNLERKRLGAFDDVNCAIFLYGLDPKRNDPARDEALAAILEVLARRQRWGEVLRFPVLEAHRPLLLRSVFRVAADYDQAKIVEDMLKSATAAERKAADFDPILAEAQVLLGKPRSELYEFVASHPEDAVRTSALRAVVERAVLIHRREALHLPVGDSIPDVHFAVQRTPVRDDVAAVAAQLFPGRPEAAAPLLAVYTAAMGTAPGAGAPVGAHLAYIRYHADLGRLDGAGSYARDMNLTGRDRRACELKAIELYAEAGRTEEAERARREFASRGAGEADQAGLAEFIGRMDSTEVPLVVRERTFAELPISDPCVLAKAIMDWSLSPNRSQRGATPWDAVVTKVAGGFDNLPEAESSTVSDAASAVKPY
ncbi:MAG TPA: hypothetical protein VMG58_13510 [Candidatus Sulfotelmatobacter sp.]|nr:hypothetical protein [Candidatus Sulfotelmatobacter sp.]